MLELDKYTFLFTALNLLILFLLMKKFLFKPVTEFMEKRAKSIRDNLDNADREIEEAHDLRMKYEEQIMHAKEDAEKILREARSRAAREHDEYVGASRKEAEALLQRAREDIMLEKAAMLKDLKSQIASLAISAASKVIEANMDTERNRDIVNKFIEEEGAA